MNIAVITDNGIQFKKFKRLIDTLQYQIHNFDFYRSEESKIEKHYEDDINELKIVNVRKDVLFLYSKYQLIFSLHCKQIFPKELLTKVRCINIHPGYNPLNRGWYPQVFAINEGKPVGATIHEIDEKLDHGKIIVREKLDILPWETSKDVYERILNLEIKLLEKWLIKILSGNYETELPEFEGEVRTRKDFKQLCELKLSESVSLGEAIDRLRALTHGYYKNAYFIDKNGTKVFVSINLERDVKS